MGACEFQTIARGKTAADAFNAAVEDANYEYGHNGYTGAINVKGGFKVFPLPESVTAEEVDDALCYASFGEHDEHGRQGIENLRRWYPRLHEQIAATWRDKWGPAVCFQVEPGTFYFCGLASS